MLSTDFFCMAIVFCAETSFPVFSERSSRVTLGSELSSAILIANCPSRVLKLCSSNARATVNSTFARNVSSRTLDAADVVPATDFASKIRSLAVDCVAVRSRLAFSITKVRGLVIELSKSLTAWLQTVV